MAESTPGRAGPLRVVHLCFADDRGGAAIGARRSHRAMLSQGIESKLVVVKKYGDDPDVIELPARPWRRRLADRLSRYSRYLYTSGNPIIRTLNLVPMGTARFLNAMEADVIQMHWIAADTISIGELAQAEQAGFLEAPGHVGVFRCRALRQPR